jgi:hypothetical protein
MPKKKGEKCLAMTLKPPSGKRQEEEISQCTRFVLDNSRFCANHQNLHDLTDEQFENNTRLCRGCKKYQYFSSSDMTCDSCRGRSDGNRAKAKETKIIYNPCVICGFTGGNERDFPNYCNKHRTDGQKADIEQRGLKWCKGIIRCCPNPELPGDYPYEKCQNCRDKESEQNHSHNRVKLEESIKECKESTKTENVPKIKISVRTKPKTLETIDRIETKTEESMVGCSVVPIRKIIGKSKIIDTTKIHETQDGFYNYEGEIYEGKHCSSCGHFHEKKEFIGVRNNYVKTCFVHCRSIDQKRDRSNRDYSEYEKRPEVREMRKLWKESHYDKCRKYWENWRIKKRSENPTEYLSHLAENMKQYRSSHREYFDKINEEHRKDIHRKYYTCQYRAKRDRIGFDLTFDECVEMFRGKCTYCGLIPSNGDLLGIDRLFSEYAYTSDNCVPCCEMCNFMKGTLYPIVFIYKCENILIHLGQLQGEQHAEIMIDECSSSYNRYRSSAEIKNLPFDLSKQQFDEICSQDCYLCGKKTNKPLHINGIDRYDSNIGYIMSNCRACCTSCNYLKNSYSYECLIEQLKLIHENNQISQA